MGNEYGASPEQGEQIRIVQETVAGREITLAHIIEDRCQWYIVSWV